MRQRRKMEDWEATRDCDLRGCIFYLGQFCFFPKGYFFVFDMIHPVSFILFLIKPSSNVFMLLFFQRLKMPQTFQHKMHENFRQYC